MTAKTLNKNLRYLFAAGNSGRSFNLLRNNTLFLAIQIMRGCCGNRFFFKLLCFGIFTKIFVCCGCACRHCGCCYICTRFIIWVSLLILKSNLGSWLFSSIEKYNSTQYNVRDYMLLGGNYNFEKRRIL